MSQDYTFQINICKKAIDDAVSLCEEIIDLLSTRKKQFEKLIDKLNFEKVYLDIADSQEVALEHTDTWRLIDRMNMYARFLLTKLNSISSHSAPDLANGPECDAKKILEKYDKDVDGIVARKVGRRIYIRTPLLATRKQVLSKEYVKNRWAIQNNTIYSDGVFRAMNSIISAPDFDSEIYRKKTVYIIFSNGERTFHLPDNDNYDTSSVTNAVTYMTPTGDGCFSCRFIFDSAHPGRLPEGTYITLLPYEDPIPDAEEIVKYWDKNPAPVIDVYALEEAINIELMS